MYIEIKINFFLSLFKNKYILGCMFKKNDVDCLVCVIEKVGFMDFL